MKRWFRYRKLRLLVSIKNNYLSAMKKIEAKNTQEMDQIQRLIYDIGLKLIHNPHSELRSNSIDYTYHIENEDYLIIIRPQSGHYSISLIENKGKDMINNFDVPFDADHVKVLTDIFEREVHKRMKSKLLMKTTKVAKHLQIILSDIEDNKLV